MEQNYKINEWSSIHISASVPLLNLKIDLYCCYYLAYKLRSTYVKPNICLFSRMEILKRSLFLSYKLKTEYNLKAEQKANEKKRWFILQSTRPSHY